MRYVVLGGGIAGVCCAEELCRFCHDDKVVLVSSYKTLKGVGNVVKYTDNLENFEIIERDLTSLPYANLTVQQGTAAGLLAGEKQVLLSDGRRLLYDKLCVCTGANPKAVAHSPHVVVLRDQGTIEALAQRLSGKRRVVLVGNGGIALEVAHALSGLQVIWAVKHKHIGDAFFDLDAAAFLCSQLPVASPASHDSPALSSAPQVSAACSSALQPTAKSPGQNPPGQKRQGKHLHSGMTHHDSPAQVPSPADSAALSSAGQTSAAALNLAHSSAQASRAANSLPQTTRQAKSTAGTTEADHRSQDAAARAEAQPQRSRHQRRGKQKLCSEPQQAKQNPQGGDTKQPAEATIKTQQFGHAVGPQWAKALPQSSVVSHITLEYGVDVTSIQSHTPDDSPMQQHRTNSQAGSSQHQSASQPSSDAEQQRVNSLGDQDSAWPVTVCLSNGRSYGADLVISAIGVEPNTGWLPQEVRRDESVGGIIVDRLMQSSVPGVYAAGDACTIAWTDQSPHWFQMRLWTQARIQGMFAAHAMAGVTDDMAFGFNFELFTHITRFCGQKVVLLGLYNGQGLHHEPEQDMVTYSRTTQNLNPTFVRVLLLRGRMQGAVLIGETELEETFEHLILDGLDLTRYGPDLLAPDVELEMIFD
ncbi:hypothetical protein WJX77_005847 [Trebouxia sp. C0004]